MNTIQVSGIGQNIATTIQTLFEIICSEDDLVLKGDCQSLDEAFKYEYSGSSWRHIYDGSSEANIGIF